MWTINRKENSKMYSSTNYRSRNYSCNMTTQWDLRQTSTSAPAYNIFLEPPRLVYLTFIYALNISVLSTWEVNKLIYHSV